MQIHSSLNDYSGSSPVITMGTFDGVHPGHKALLEKVKELAVAGHTESLVITFWPHPRQVLLQDAEKLRLLTTLEEKTKLISETGIDHLMVLPFTAELAALTAQNFTENILVNKLHVKHLVTGFNHKFGKGGITFKELTELSRKHNFKLTQFRHIDVNGDHPSSTKIRHLLLEGNIEGANHLLGYSYAISGTVIGGQRLGRTIAYPTANVLLQERSKLVPPDGVYACRVKVTGKLFYGMVNIGIRPTVNHQMDHRSIEVHILDFHRDIYSEEIVVFFEKRIRDEMKFSGIDTLKEQLQKDEIIIRQILTRTK